MFALLARYVDEMGYQAQEPTAPRYALHGENFRDALVRDSTAQSIAGDKDRRKPGAHSGRPRGRVYDAASKKIVNSDELAERASPEPITEGESGIALIAVDANDVTLPIESTAAQGTRSVIPKAGSYKFCTRWQYDFRDQGRGEDLLKNISGQTYGTIASAHAWYNLFLGGSELFNGYMDASGCTPVFSLSAGTYGFQVWSALGRDGRFMFVYPTSSQQWRTFWTNITVSGVAGGTNTRYFNLGLNDAVAATAAVATELIKRTDMGIQQRTYKVFAEEHCPDIPGSACYSPGDDAVFLGRDGNQNFKAFSKYVVAHELGHAIGQHLYGNIDNPYTDTDSAKELCRCDHVPPDISNNLHCMQSREFVSAAQAEGWGQFFGADLFNDPAQADCIHVYYKTFLPAPGFPVAPPVALSCVHAYIWLESQCTVENNKGTELDWMNFYYEVNNKTANKFSVNQLGNVYKEGCDGMCNDDALTWSNLLTAVSTLHGAGSAKRQHWFNVGNRHGVDH